jgi:hypothetical protein
MSVYVSKQTVEHAVGTHKKEEVRTGWKDDIKRSLIIFALLRTMLELLN